MPLLILDPSATTETAPPRASVAGMAEAGSWIILRRPVIQGDDTVLGADFALLHPDRGVALVDVGQPRVPDLVSRVQARLEDAVRPLGLPRCPAVVHVTVPEDGLAELPRLLQVAFAAEPIPARADPRWIEAAREVFAPAAEVTPPAAAEERIAGASRRGRKVIVVACGMMVLVGAAVIYRWPPVEATAPAWLDTSTPVPAMPMTRPQALPAPDPLAPDSMAGAEEAPVAPVAPMTGPTVAQVPESPLAPVVVPAQPPAMSSAALPEAPQISARVLSELGEAEQAPPGSREETTASPPGALAFAAPRPAEPSRAANPPSATGPAGREAIGLRCTQLISRLQLREPLSSRDRQFLRTSCARRL